MIRPTDASVLGLPRSAANPVPPPTAVRPPPPVKRGSARTRQSPDCSGTLGLMPDAAAYQVGMFTPSTRLVFSALCMLGPK
jgi:hypothetical protein